MTERVMDEGKKGVAPYLLLGLAAALLVFWALGCRGLWAAEGRWAEVTREMFLSGDFFHPNINGEPYFDKPLLTYWLVAAASLLAGKVDEWAIRLPSALSALTAIGATVWLGRRLWSAQVGLVAGWLLLSSYGFLFWARTGTADLENLAAVILAVAWYWSRRERPGFGGFFVFYLIAFTGALTKGLTAVVVPALAILPDVLAAGRWRRFLKPSHFLALALAGGLYLVPFVYASLTRGDYQASGLALVFQENVQRYFDPFDHKQPFYIYFRDLPMLLLPWAPFLLGALAWAGRRWKSLDANARWLLQAAALIFLFFTASGSRRSYYILPILPFCTLWLALYLRDGLGAQADALSRFFRRFQWGLLAAVGLLELVSPLFWPLLAARTGFAAPAGLLPALALTGLAALGILALGRWRPQALRRLTGAGSEGAVLLAAAVLLGSFFCWQSTALETLRTEQGFALELKRQMAGLAPEQVAFYDKIETNVLFYLDLPRPVRLVASPEAARSFLDERGGERIVVLREKFQTPLATALPDEFRREPSFAEEVFPWEKKSRKKLVAYRFAAAE